jgi:hypothetical protein
MWEPRRLTTQWASTAWHRELFTLSRLLIFICIFSFLTSFNVHIKTENELYFIKFRLSLYLSLSLASQDSPVIIAMGFVLGERGLIPGSRKRFFSSPESPGLLWGPTSLLRNGYRRFFLGVKRPGHEVDHLPPSST